MELNSGHEAFHGDPGEGSLTHRQCLINITNRCDDCTLGNPRWYIYSGKCASPLPPIICEKASGSALFVKTPHTACGAVGVVTYDILFDKDRQAGRKIAIMFSAPFDLISFKNMFAVGIFDKSKECNSDLFHEMYEGTSESFISGKAADGPLDYKGQRVRIQATMSDAYQTEMKVHVSDTGCD